MFRSTLIRAILAVVLAFAAPLAMMAQTPATPAPAAQAAAAAPRSSGDTDYVLGIGDSIDVAVVGRTDFGGRARVGADGAIVVQYLGTVSAAGQTPGQLAEVIRVGLEKGGFFSQPVVRIEVVTVASRFVTVLGSVTSPGLISLDRQYRLSEILAKVGGRAENGADFLVVTRETGQSAQFKLAELATGTGDKDPYVMNGDKIYLPAAQNQVFYVSGQVKQAGAYPVTEGLTVRMALARAGGITDTGSEKKVKINRKGQPLKSVKLDETIVEQGDILTVGERLF